MIWNFLIEFPGMFLFNCHINLSISTSCSLRATMAEFIQQLKNKLLLLNQDVKSRYHAILFLGKTFGKTLACSHEKYPESPIVAISKRHISIRVKRAVHRSTRGEENARESRKVILIYLFFTQHAVSKQ